MKRFILPVLLVAFTASASAQDTYAEETYEAETYEADPVQEAVVAPDSGMQLNYVRRGLTLPKMTLRGDLTLGITGGGGGTTDFSMSIGGSFGIIDNLEVGISSWRMGTMRGPFGPPGSLSGLISLRFTNGFAFGDIPLWGRYRILDGKFELAVELGLLIPTNSFFGLWAGVPMRIHLSDSFTIDTGVHFGVSFVTGGAFTDLRIPVELNFGIGDAMYVGLNTGLGVADFEGIYVPLGAQFGYTINLGDGNPLLDLEAEFLFPNFIRTGFGGDAIQTNFYIGVAGRFYYGL